MQIDQYRIGRMPTMRKGIALRDHQLWVIGLRAQGLVASAHVRELRTAHHIVLQFRGFLCVAQSFEEMFLVQHAARGPQARLQLTAMRTLRETSLEYGDRFLVTTLIDQRIGKCQLRLQLVGAALERGPCVGDALRLGIDLAAWGPVSCVGHRQSHHGQQQH